MALNQQLITKANSLYESWLAMKNFDKRESQQEMIAFVIESLLNREYPIGVVEAGTGTGKTVAFCTAALTVAEATESRAVIVTATVALQDQILKQELPELLNLLDSRLSFALAKGRRRYLCPARLEKHVLSAGSLGDDLASRRQSADDRVPQNLWESWRDGSWQGDLDYAPADLKDSHHVMFTTDSHGCTNRECRWFDTCPYFESRRRLENANVVVTNYDLLMTDLPRDTGFLGDPEETVYVFDEAHRLYERTSSAMSNSLATNEAKIALEALVQHSAEISRRARESNEIANQLNVISACAIPVLESLNRIADCIRSLDNAREKENDILRFEHGVVPGPLSEILAPVAVQSKNILEAINVINEKLKLAVKGENEWLQREVAYEFLQENSRHVVNAERLHDVYTDWAQSEIEGQKARWVAALAHEDGDINSWQLNTVPIAVEDILHKLVWQRCRGAVCASATLCTADGFGYFKQSIGIAESAPELFIRSPFDFEEAVTLRIANTKAEVGKANYEKEIARTLPRVLKDDFSGLVIFTSRQTLNAVVGFLDKKFLVDCVIQDSSSRQQLIHNHKSRIDKNQRSFLIGLAGMREGIDLPGDYCRHVVITRLPFDVPTDPVVAARKERLQQQGIVNYENFLKFDVPEATLRLIQACGRLIRNEVDYGRITILDRRIIEKRYGQRMLDALPPYKRELG